MLLSLLSAICNLFIFIKTKLHTIREIRRTCPICRVTATCRTWRCKTMPRGWPHFWGWVLLDEMKTKKSNKKKVYIMIKFYFLNWFVICLLLFVDIRCNSFSIKRIWEKCKMYMYVSNSAMFNRSVRVQPEGHYDSINSQDKKNMSSAEYVLLASLQYSFNID